MELSTDSKQSAKREHETVIGGDDVDLVVIHVKSVCEIRKWLDSDPVGKSAE
ncbi:hypothetical protein KI387_036330, partial [Taxus chinensis]